MSCFTKRARVLPHSRVRLMWRHEEASRSSKSSQRLGLFRPRSVIILDLIVVYKVRPANESTHEKLTSVRNPSAAVKTRVLTIQDLIGCFPMPGPSFAPPSSPPVSKLQQRTGRDGSLTLRASFDLVRLNFPILRFESI